MKADVLIIGAGPAGLTAAYEVAKTGLCVLIIDEHQQAGGQLWQQSQMLALPDIFPNMRGFELAQFLVERLEGLAVEWLLGHRVIGVYEDGQIGVTNDKDVFPVFAEKIIIATGAAENAIPFPKWTLPGVMTIGAAQSVVNRDRVKPGSSAVIYGDNSFASDVCELLLSVEVNIVAIVKQNKQLGNPTFRDMNIPLYENSSIIEARGNGKLEEIDIQTPHGMITLKPDIVLIDGGQSPILDIVYQLDCALRYQAELGGWLPVYNHQLQTSKNHVYVTGNAAGVSNHSALILTGMLAAASVCEALQSLPPEKTEVVRNSLYSKLENEEESDTFSARKEHIKQFSTPQLKDQFIS